MTLYRFAALTERQAAEHVAQRLRRALDGPPDRLDTWRAAAQNLGIAWLEYHNPHGSRGEFSAPYPDGEPPSVAINTAYLEREACRAAAHELAHVILRQMQPPLLPGWGDAGRYEGEPSDHHHRIARRVERLAVP